ncbi:hypothetical protein ACIRRA_19250 [Nocardia sp. NPDC101769]|uniref:hypothetical protein n=1 Tax=Nocardia sp. NPDC101769 TaxID=3364333 RepID=UPI00383023D8
MRYGRLPPPHPAVEWLDNRSPHRIADQLARVDAVTATLLGHPDGSVGFHMTPEVVALPRNLPALDPAVVFAPMVNRAGGRHRAGHLLHDRDSGAGDLTRVLGI